jgi:Hint domain-containing protein
MTPQISQTSQNDCFPAASAATRITDADPVVTDGLVHDTLLLTQRGEIAVQDLKPGDKVISRNAGLARLTGILQRHVRLDIVSIAAGSLGHTRPEQDLLLPAGQQVLIRDWRAQALCGKPQALIAALALVDDEFIQDLGPRLLRIYHLQFDGPQVVYAGGLELACGGWPEVEIRPAA